MLDAATKKAKTSLNYAQQTCPVGVLTLQSYHSHLQTEVHQSSIMLESILPCVLKSLIISPQPARADLLKGTVRKEKVFSVILFLDLVEL